MKTAFMAALSRVWPRLYLGQWLGNGLLMFLAAAWLQIPDSHAWQFAFSLVSALLLAAGFFWLYTTTFRYLQVDADRGRWWQAWFWLASFVGIWWLMLQLIAVGRTHEALYAGYWNSQSPRWLRYHLGYSGLVAWQERIYDCVQWLCGGLLLPLAMVAGAGNWRGGWLVRVARVYRHWFYWVVLLACALGGDWITWALADWTPVLGLAGQTMSLIVRLAIAYSIDVWLWCLVLALTSHYLDQAAPAPKASG